MEHRSKGDPVPGFPSDDEISLVEIAAVIMRNLRAILVFSLALALLVGLWTFSQGRTYAASATFLPQTSEGRVSGSATALAQQFGLSLGSDRPGQSPQFYVNLLQSLAVLRQAVESVYEVPGSDGNVRRATLIELFEVEGRGTVPAWRRTVDELRKDMTTAVVRETGVVRLTVSTSHPALSEQVVQRLLELVNEFNMEVRQTRAQEEGRFIEGRVADAQAELLAAEAALQAFLRQNREFGNSPDLLFERERLHRQVAMRQEVYTALLRAHEDVRIDAVRDTPLLSVIDPPAGSAEPEGRGTVLRTALAFVIGLMAAVFAALIGEFRRRSRETDDPHYRELEGLARQAWEDIRRPGRWLRRGEKPVAAGDR
jgi:uncharacterized protein involved in exopolysaccharide biosynthesis